MDEIEKLKYLVVLYNILAFVFGMFAGFSLAQRRNDNDQENN
jgi:uncharacterized protein YneF (UPF0154 family)